MLVSGVTKTRSWYIDCKDKDSGLGVLTWTEGELRAWAGCPRSFFCTKSTGRHRSMYDCRARQLMRRCETCHAEMTFKMRDVHRHPYVGTEGHSILASRCNLARCENSPAGRACSPTTDTGTRSGGNLLRRR